MKKWKPAPSEAVAAFEAATSDLRETEPRKMFGYSCIFAKGHMFAGLHKTVTGTGQKASRGKVSFVVA